MIESGDVHVYPTAKDHECSPDCWCEPAVDFVSDDGTKVWLHRETH